MHGRVLYVFLAVAAAVALSAGVAHAQDAEDGRFDDAIETEDGYVISGTLQFEGEDHEGYATKVDREGNGVWDLSVGDDGVDYLSSVVETSDGYLFAGAQGAPNKNVKGDAWLLKTDEQGNVDWRQTYEGEGRSAFYTAHAVDNGYIAMGSSNSEGGIVVRLDENGERIWTRSHATVIADSIRTEEGFVVVGGKVSSGLSTWFATIDDEGELIDEKTYDAGTNRFSTILELDDGGYMLGTYRSNEVVKVDEEGNEEWTTDVDMQYVYDIERVEENRFAVGGGIPATASRTTSLVEIDGDGETLREYDFGYSVTEVLDTDVEGGDYVIVAQSARDDVLAVVQEPSDGSRGDRGDGDTSGSSDDGSDAGSEGETDPVPLGTPAQTLAMTLGVLLVSAVLATRLRG